MQGHSRLCGRPSIDPRDPEDLFRSCQDGLVLCALINDSVPETIDERVLNFPAEASINTFQMTENNNVVINSAKGIGCSVVNIGAQDLIEGRQHLVLGLIWQVIKRGLLGKINLQLHPELFRLLEAGEELADLLKLPADALLLRWVNYQLRQARWEGGGIGNLTSDIADARAYTVLLAQLCPDTCDRSALALGGRVEERAEAVVSSAQRIGCGKYISAKAILDANPRLNLAFVANLFNHYPGLAPLSETELASLDEGLFASLGDREARAFALWLNSLGVEPFVNNLFEDLKDGRVLLQAMDHMCPGLVPWRRANMRDPLNRFKCVENTNLVLELAKTQMHLSLVGVQGADITDGSRTLTLGLVWQLMREHILLTLGGLSAISDADMIEWANRLVKGSPRSTSQPISSFKDPSLKTGLYLLDLLAAIKPAILDPALIQPANDDNDDDDEAAATAARMNAKYAISVARKLGATIFLLPEDICEVRPKMILTFIGSLMAIHNK